MPVAEASPDSNSDKEKPEKKPRAEVLYDTNIDVLRERYEKYFIDDYVGKTEEEKLEDSVLTQKPVKLDDGRTILRVNPYNPPKNLESYQSYNVPVSSVAYVKRDKDKEFPEWVNEEITLDAHVAGLHYALENGANRYSVTLSSYAQLTTKEASIEMKVLIVEIKLWRPKKKPLPKLDIA